jgi:hypothetical protein
MKHQYIEYRENYAVCHNIHLTSFSVFTTLGTISACSYLTPWWWHFEMPKHVEVYKAPIYWIPRKLCRLSQYTSPILLCFHGIGHHLSIFISDSLMKAFWNTETCRSILSTNTLNEWCICWSFTHHNHYYILQFYTIYTVITTANSWVPIQWIYLHYTLLYLILVYWW